MKLVKRGAEADIYRTVWCGSPAIAKVRKPRTYRDPTLDARLRRQRTIRESQAISRIKRHGIPTPLVYHVDAARSTITMQYIPGSPVHDLPDDAIIKVSCQAGRLIGMMHKAGMMHGDLTTSNFILYRDIIHLIDFGLSQNTIKPEDHAVDLRLIKETLNSAHAGIMEPAWSGLLEGYEKAVGSGRHSRIIGIVSDIEGRGRYARVV